MSKIKSFAKINFDLRVIKKLKNNFHNIRNIYSLINLADDICIKKTKAKKDQLKFFGRFSKDIDNKNNSIKRILKFLREKKQINNFYEIKIYKKIPAFAGLGGGSSNAFFVSKFFLKRKKLISYKKQISNIIGTDFTLFYNSSGYQENLTKIIALKKFNIFILLVFPNIKCSSKNIYSKIRLKKNNKISKIKKFDERSLWKYLLKSKNDLQNIVESKYPKIIDLINSISNQKGCVFARMTGSGSACYGIFKSKNHSLKAFIKIKKKFPKYWCVNTKTI